MAAYLGDCHPAILEGFPFTNFSDPNEDGFNEYLPPAGTALITDGASPTNPDGSVGGLPWDDAQIYRAYHFQYPAIIGYRETRASATIAGGENLRCGHVILGMEAGSSGSFTVSGFGSLFSNDRDAVPGYIKRAIGLARSEDPDTITYPDLYTNTAGYVGGSPFTNPPTPIPAGAYNLWCGRKGIGRLNVFQAGVANVRNRLLVGGYEPVEDTQFAGAGTPNPEHPDAYGPVNGVAKIVTVGEPLTWVDGPGGVVLIDGVGSLLTITGKTGASTATASPVSIIGRNGVVSITNDGGLWAGSGLENRGVILVGGEGSTNTITVSPTVAGTTPSLVNTGLIYVRKGATLALSGPVTNEGEIFIEHGGALTVTEAIDGTAPKYGCPTAFALLEDGLAYEVARTAAFD